MKFSPALMGCLLSLALTTGAFAAATPDKTPPPAPAAAPAPAAPAPPVAAAPTSKLDEFLAELGGAMKLSDDEKKSVQTAYQADGVLLQNILNNDTKSPLQKAQEVSDLRTARNTKIEALLQDSDRKMAFLKVEAKYRVALTELAADGGLVAPPAPAPAAAPAPAPATPPAK